ncbi:MAG: Smr/MutS family protein [Bacteroidetes bacterium]|nr:Smr/MutS family protein [Bacteroidota bacterium]
MLEEGAEVSLLHSAGKARIIKYLPNGWVRVCLLDADMEIDLRTEELVGHAISPPRAIPSTEPKPIPGPEPAIPWIAGVVSCAIQLKETGLDIRLHNATASAIEGYAYLSTLPGTNARVQLQSETGFVLWKTLPAEAGVLTLHVLYSPGKEALAPPPEALCFRWTNKNLLNTRGNTLVIRPELPQGTHNPLPYFETMATPKVADRPAAPPPAELVVDLHLEVLVPSPTAIDEIHALELQMAHFEKMLNQAIVSRCPSVVFIHGVGAGVLRKSIREQLKRYKAVRQVTDDHSGKYGNGATRVLLHR